MGNSSSAASLPYTIGDCIHPASSRPYSNGWAVHDGKRKSDGAPVTVFKLSKSTLVSNGIPSQPNGESILLSAHHHFAKIKTLVHPQVLRAYATLDTDDPDGTSSTPNAPPPATSNGDFIIVTEPVVPLITFLDSRRQSQDGLAWGLHNLIHALHFLHNNAKLSHGRVSLESLYVTPGGDFKLGDFSLLSAIPLTDHFRECERVVCPPDYRSPERVAGEYDLVSDCAPHVFDSYGLGIVIEEMFAHPNAGAKVPNKLIKAIARLKTPNVKMRPRVFPLLRCPIFDCPLIKSLDFLEGIAAKPVEEKIMFYQSVPDLLKSGTMDVSTVGRFKLLPQLIMSVQTITAGGPANMTQDVNRREMMAVIPPLFMIIEYLTSSEEASDQEFFQTQIIPLITLLFQINDRGVRGALLSRISFLSSHIPKATLNSSIFEPMCSGFSDSSAPLRELTLKSTIALVPFLMPSSLEKLTRYLIRLQSDTEASIRTNTIIFVGKIIHSLGENQRQKLILPAFTRAMRDDFLPCRLAALKAVLQCKEFFEPRILAKDVLPTVCPHLMDKALDVREEAFRVVDEFMVVLKDEAQRMAEEQDGEIVERAPQTDEKEDSKSGGWAMSGLGSWAMGGIMSSAKGESMDDQPISESTNQPTDQTKNIQMHSTAPPSNVPTEVTTTNDGWSDDEEEDNYDTTQQNIRTPSWIEDTSQNNKASAITKKVPGFTQEDDFFSSFDKPAVTTTTAALGGVGKGKLMVPSNSSSLATSKKTLAERRAEFEKRKALRQQQLQQQEEAEGGKDD